MVFTDLNLSVWFTKKSVAFMDESYDDWRTAELP
jgi:hypothetical protein